MTNQSAPEPLSYVDHLAPPFFPFALTPSNRSSRPVTSVDIIFLLECLVGDIFNIEEKNRIRRNLEGFRPKTVSKNKVGTEEFFQKIMDFPAPKPRNIEKDVKVFDWGVLPQALDKIISKYVSQHWSASRISVTDVPRRRCILR